MQIDKLQIEQFGGLRDRQIIFSPGFNLIYGENESGKSTLLSFIRAMFYGLNSSARKIAENERKLRLPWGEERMGGWLDFTHNGRAYRLERSFGKTKRLDQISLRNNLTGEQLAIPSSQEIGNWLFGVGEAEFNNTVFISQSASANVVSEADTLAKLTNLASSGDERVSSTEVDSRLRKAMVYYKAEKGNGGLIAELQGKRENLIAERRSVLEQEANRSELLQTYQFADQTRVRFETALSTGNECLQKSKKLERVLRLEEFTQRQQELSRLEQKAIELRASLQLADGYCGWDELNELYDHRNRISEGKAQIAVWQAQSEHQRAELETISERLAEKKAASKKNKRLAISALLGLILLIAGIFSGWLVTPVLYTLILPGLLLIVYYFQQSRLEQAGHKQTELEAQAEQLSAAINQRTVELEAATTEQTELEAALRQNLLLLEKLPLYSAGNTAAVADEERLAAVRRRLTELDHLETIINERQTNLKRDNFADEATDTSGEATASETRQQLADFFPAGSTSLLTELNDYFASLEQTGLIEVKIILKPEDSNAYWLEQLQAVLAELQKQSQAAAIEAAGLEAELRHRFGQLRNPEDIDRELEKIDQQLREAQTEYAALALARATYDSAFSELQQSFGPQLNQRGGDLLAELTAGVHTEMRVDRDLRITIPDPQTDQLHEYDYLSGGTIDQAYLALRLAVAELISGDAERLPLLLDDVLIQYDDERAAAGLDLLERYAAEHNLQILLFTCQSRPLGKTTGNVISLNPSGN